MQYIKGVLRKPGESEGWNALLEADRLDLSFEDMVLNAGEPIRGLFSEEDQTIAARSLGEQQREIQRRRDEAEAEAVEHDRQVVAEVATRRRAAGKPWTAEMEAQMLADRAERWRKSPLARQDVCSQLKPLARPDRHRRVSATNAARSARIRADAARDGAESPNGERRRA